MRFASSTGWLVCALCTLAALSAGCEAMMDPPVRTFDAGAFVSRGAAQSGAAGRATRSVPAAQGGGPAHPYLGDVPARAASGGERPCGSSEFSVSPCGGRPADEPSLGGAGTPADDSDAGASPAADSSEPEPSDCRVVALPERVRAAYHLDPFYKKYASAHGLPVLASDSPVDRTLELACLLVKEMIVERPDVHAALLANHVTFAILGRDEVTRDIPEYRDLPDYYDTRSRGLGGHTGLCAEENVLCDRQHDPYRGQSVCVHELAHTIAIYGLFDADSTFEDRLAEAYRSAREAGLWSNTLAAQDAQEYWAEGVQAWYDTNVEADPPDGVHGPINTRRELAAYDRVLYELIDELLPSETRWPDCYRKRL